MKSVLQTVATHLLNLQRLSIYPKYSGAQVSVNILRSLVASSNLTKLSLINWKVEDVNGILNCLQEFPTLRKLKYFSDYKTDVGMSIQLQQSIIDLAKNLPHLEKICLANLVFKRCPLIFLEFIRFAENLKEIHMHDWKVRMTQDFALQIVEVLSSSRPTNAAPLKLFIKQDNFDEQTYRNNFNAILELGITDVLHINENCKHEGEYKLNW